MKYKTIIILLFITDYTKCDANNNIQQKVKNLKYRYQTLYGKPKDEGKQWNSEWEGKLSYPRSGSQKLAEIAHMWWVYYECTYRLTTKMTATRGLPSAILAVYDGAVARLPCTLCMAPDERKELVWSYAKSTKNLTFYPMEDKDRIVHEEDSYATIYHVERSDSGVYRCRIGQSVGGLVILEVLDSAENYTVVKPTTSPQSHRSLLKAISKELIIFTSWSSWSECSACARVGRRRRYGLCYVRMVDVTQDVQPENASLFAEPNKAVLSPDARNLFEAFPEGVPCRSQLLPVAVRNMAEIVKRRNEIMIAMCKVPCGSVSGFTLEFAEDQKQPPLPARDITFAVCGRPVVIRCPGTTLRDMPVSWRVGTKHVVPGLLDRASAGRVHLNARDHLVFTAVQYADTNLYSCWQAGNLAGTVKLVAWCGRSYCSRSAALAAAVAAAGAVLRVADRVLRNKQRTIALL